MVLDAADLGFHLHRYLVQLTSASGHCNLRVGSKDGGFAMPRPTVRLLGTVGHYCPIRHVTVSPRPTARDLGRKVTHAPIAITLRGREQEQCRRTSVREDRDGEPCCPHVAQSAKFEERIDFSSSSACYYGSETGCSSIKHQSLACFQGKCT